MEYISEYRTFPSDCSNEKLNQLHFFIERGTLTGAVQQKYQLGYSEASTKIWDIKLFIAEI